MQLYLIWVCPKIGYSPPWVSGFGIRQISNLQTNPRGDILVDVGNVLVLMISRIKLDLFTVNMAHLSRAGRFSRAASCTIATCQEVSLWNTSASCSGMRRFSQSFACWHSQFLWGRMKGQTGVWHSKLVYAHDLNCSFYSTWGIGQHLLFHIEWRNKHPEPACSRFTAGDWFWSIAISKIAQLYRHSVDDDDGQAARSRKTGECANHRIGPGFFFFSTRNHWKSPQFFGGNNTAAGNSGISGDFRWTNSQAKAIPKPYSTKLRFSSVSSMNTPCLLRCSSSWGSSSGDVDEILLGVVPSAKDWEDLK